MEEVTRGFMRVLITVAKYRVCILHWERLGDPEQLLRFPSSLELRELWELPCQLRRLDCSQQRLERLPKRLPADLIYLACDRNQLRQLPRRLPRGLQTLMCHHNPLKELPSLPASLTSLEYCSTHLQRLPIFPGALRRLVVHCDEHAWLPRKANLLLLSHLRALWAISQCQRRWRALVARRRHVSLFSECLGEVKHLPGLGKEYYQAMERITNTVNGQ